MNGVGWGGDFRGLLTKSYIFVRGERSGFRLRSRAARLQLGDHPRARVLHDLDIDPRPMLTAYMPRLDAVLDDHVESWYLTSGSPPGPPEVGYADVADVPLSQEWLQPPDRDAIDADAQGADGAERAGGDPT
jgi:hypothetical protein